MVNKLFKTNILKNKKAQELSVNLVVTIIIGLIIFGLGMGLFSKISNSGNQEVEKLNEQVKTGIMSLACQGEDWICSPAYDIKNGDGATYTLFIANRGDDRRNFVVDFVGMVNNKLEVNSSNCGFITIEYLTSLEILVSSGQSAEVPFIVKARNVGKTPCSFIATAVLKDLSGGTFEEKAAVIIKVK